MTELIPAPSLTALSASVGSHVAVETADAPISLEIATIHRAAAQQGYESFSLILNGPTRTTLPGGVHRVVHESLGAFDLCLNPTWGHDATSDTREYEAVFNRRVESEREAKTASSALGETSSRRGFFSRVAAAAAGGGLIAGLLARDTAQAQPLRSSAAVSGAPLSAEPYIGGIGMFGGSFAPRGWASCDGQLLSIAQNSALFSILGTVYGGDGRTTFGLPDMRGRVPVHTGQGPGLSNRLQGQRGGTEAETLSSVQIPNHAHPSALPVTSAQGNAASPAGNVLAAQPASRGTQPMYNSGGSDGTMDVNSGAVGGSQPHNNMPPFTVIRFVIALTGLFPPRN